MAAQEVTVWTDGASRGNPGPAATAFVIAVDGVQVIEYAEPIGQATNNIAEYTAMIRALACCQKLGVTRVRLHSDSELMVRQMQGTYRVKNPDILKLFEEARTLVDGFQQVKFVHVPRAENAEADRLGNEALDGRPTPLPLLDGFRFPDAPVDDGAAPDPDVEVIAVLHRAHSAWSEGESRPKPGEVWAEMQKILFSQKRLQSDHDGRSQAAAKPKRKK